MHKYQMHSPILRNTGRKPYSASFIYPILTSIWTHITNSKLNTKANNKMQKHILIARPKLKPSLNNPK